MGPIVRDPAALHGLRARFHHLVRGRRRRVLRPFVDFDGDRHPDGEAWTFPGTAFLPYDDGWSLMVTDGQGVRHLRLQDRPDAQGPVLDALAAHPVEAPGRWAAVARLTAPGARCR